MAETTIRAATAGDAEAISVLIGGLVGYSLADPSDPGAAAPFLETVTPGSIRGYLESDSFVYHVAVEAGVVVGAVGIRDGSHLYHLWVRESHHGHGVGRALWTHALEHAGHPELFTVNSSPYAVPVYRRFGFEPVAEEIRKDGVAFVPMERRTG